MTFLAEFLLKMRKYAKYTVLSHAKCAKIIFFFKHNHIGLNGKKLVITKAVSQKHISDSKIHFSRKCKKGRITGVHFWGHVTHCGYKCIMYIIHITTYSSFVIFKFYVFYIASCMTIVYFLMKRYIDDAVCTCMRACFA